MALSLLARYAQCIFWMARYVERAENLARIIDVHESFARDGAGTRSWMSIVQLNADEKRFFDLHPTANSQRVVHFYMIDRDNPSSILSAIRAARENARTLRPLISTEMWTQLNIFYNHLRDLTPSDLNMQNIPRLCNRIKESCQTHSGITEGTFHRDQGYYFYQLGKYIERADMGTRLIDIKYHSLLSSPQEPGSPLDVAQWNALLRTAAAYHAFRRTHQRLDFSPETVAGFLLMNESFPRSVLVCIHEVDRMLHELRRRYGLKGGFEALEVVDHLRTALISLSIEQVAERGLHEFLDWIQCMLQDLSNEIGRAYFGVDLPPAQELRKPLEPV